MSNGAKIVLVVCLFFAVVVVVNLVKRDIDEKAPPTGQNSNIGKIRPEPNSLTKSPGTVDPKNRDPKTGLPKSAQGPVKPPTSLSANPDRNRPAETPRVAEPVSSLFDPLAGGSGDAAGDARSLTERSSGPDDASRVGAERTPQVPTAPFAPVNGSTAGSADVTTRGLEAGDSIGADRDVAGPKPLPSEAGGVSEPVKSSVSTDKSVAQPERKPVVEPAPAVLRTHKVAPGDSLWDLAADYLGDPGRFREILSANPELGDGSTLKVGTVIKIPAKEIAAKVAPSKDVVAKDAAGDKQNVAKAATGDRQKVAKDGAADAKPKSKDPAPPADKSKYTIQTGDNLYQVAKRLLGNGARWREIVDLNPGLDPENLRVGFVIKVPPTPPK